MLKSKSKKHNCSLNIGSDSMLPKKDGKGGLCHALRKLTLVAVHHPNTKIYFKSYPAIVAERQRQIIEGGLWVIHPFSLFSLVWRTFMLIINMLFVLLAPTRFAYILPTPVPTHSQLDYMLLTLKGIVVLDMILTFNTGYRHKDELYIVLNKRRIALNYLSGWFYFDLITCIPIAFMVPYTGLSYRFQMFMKLCPCLRCFIINDVFRAARIFLKLINISFVWRRLLRHNFFFIILLHWCNCTLYLAPVVNLYWYGKPPVGYTHFLVDEGGDITKAPALDRYEKAAYIACAAFFGTSFTAFRAVNADEMVTNAAVILCGQVFMMYTIALFLKIYVTEHNSVLKYQELMNQVEMYMRYKRFPLQMKNRVRDFYRYRYQERYFMENLALDCLSEQLRNEISLDTCQKLIEKVSLFEGLPAGVVGSVLGCLHPEVYMPNDLVARAGDIGECMYFIACGTVAVYSLKGAEVCHLDDGAHFGEVALLMKDRKRVATVVAIEITQVYRLDQRDFRDFIMTYQELYERLEALASKRMHETVLIDEAYKLQRYTL